jgi:uncharacterized protein (TIGR03084 family)
MQGELVDAVRDQNDELRRILGGDGWDAPTRCDGWDVRDVVLHLAQTNEMAIGSLTGTYDEVLAGLTDGLPPAADVDEGAALMVARDRGSREATHDRWAASVDRLLDAFAAVEPDERVRWVAGQLRASTLAATRLAETWIHTGDVAGALGIELAPQPRLRHVARLAWRTIPYAFQKAGRPAPGPTAFRLTGPDGAAWILEPDETAVNVIAGPGADLCNLAAQRCRPADTSLVGEGPDAAAVLDLVRTYA